MSSLSTTEDLTARARIIAVALDRFAALGYRATTVRSIAADAGVSPALIIHHFGGKEGLRRECDERIVRFVTAKQAPDTPVDALAEAARRFGPYLPTSRSGCAPARPRPFLRPYTATSVDAGASGDNPG